MGSRESFDATPRKNNLNFSSLEASLEASPDASNDGLSPQERKGLREECARTAVALTALFDGEANGEEGLLARTHLGECLHCDDLLESWQQQNQMLRSLSAPVPPGLLTRVLTAIRLLSALPQMRARLEAKTTRFEPQSGPISDARLLPEVVFVSGANPFAPRRTTQGFAPKIEAPRELPPLDPMSPLPPANLRDEILRRTTGVASGQIISATQHLVSATDFEAPITAHSRRRSHRSLRFSVTIVPALAAWLIFLSGPSGLWSPLLESRAPQSQVATPLKHVSLAPRKSPNLVAETAANAGEPIEQAIKRAAPAKQSIAIEKPVVAMPENSEADLVENTAPAPLALAPLASAPQITLSAPQIESQSAPQKLPALAAPPVATVTVSTTKAPAVQAPAAIIAMLPKSKPSMETTAKSASIARYRPATTTAEMELRTRRASWNASSSVLPVARPLSRALGGNHVTAPQPNGIGDNADNDVDAETLEHVNRLNDARPEDVRNVLDDYRASLLAENADADSLAIPQG